MKQITKISLFSLAVLIILTACGAEQANFQTDKYSLSYPTNWKKVEAGNQDLQGLDTVFFAFDAQGQVQSSLSVFYKKGQQVSEFESYLQAETESLKKLKDYESIKSEKATISKLKTRIETFKAWDESSQSVKQFLQTYIPGTDGLYILTASFPLTVENATLTETKKIMKSFSLLAAQATE